MRTGVSDLAVKAGSFASQSGLTVAAKQHREPPSTAYSGDISLKASQNHFTFSPIAKRRQKCGRGTGRPLASACATKHRCEAIPAWPLRLLRHGKPQGEDTSLP